MKFAFRLVVASALVALPFMVVPWHHQRVDAQTPQTRPRATPLANSAIDGQSPTYVGKDICKECHAENHKLHSVHGHAHTFRMANEPEVIEKFSGRTYETPEGYGTYSYDVVDGQLVAKIPEKFGDQPFALQFALGSGHHGMTLFSLVPDSKFGTVGIEHRASWYHKGDLLGATPGQLHTQPETPSELFGQRHVGEVMRKCVDCHVTTGEIKDQTVVNLTPSVNCEKCHGPGSVHVAQARKMKKPPPYSIGKKEWDAESEIQLCGDCHRMPAAISRKELREYPAPLTRFQPIGMLRSECYLESNDTMKCTTCHSPHTTVAAFDTDFYVRKCIQCHDPNQSSQSDQKPHTLCSVNQSSGCIECHMPATAIDDYGTEFHDHWIRVHPDK
ncbi:MAG: multiheme c-type cytochrome [Planctomycetota bacterium]